MKQPAHHPGRPRDADLAEHRRTEILAQATRIFGERGFRHTDVEMIAAAAAVSKGTVYRYFPTKEQLFLNTVDNAMQWLQERLDLAMRQADMFEDGLDKPMYAAIEAHLSFFDEHPEVVELLIQERAEFKDRTEPSLQVYLNRNRPAWKTQGDTLREQGRLRNIGSETMHDFMVQLIYGTIFVNYFKGRQASVQQQARSMTEIVLWGVLSDAERAAIGGPPEGSD